MRGGCAVLHHQCCMTVLHHPLLTKPNLHHRLQHHQALWHQVRGAVRRKQQRQRVLQVLRVLRSLVPARAHAAGCLRRLCVMMLVCTAATPTTFSSSC